MSTFTHGGRDRWMWFGFSRKSFLDVAYLYVPQTDSSSCISRQNLYQISGYRLQSIPRQNQANICQPVKLLLMRRIFPPSTLFTPTPVPLANRKPRFNPLAIQTARFHF